MKPDFIIVGVMKGGTSTLAYLLGHQQDIVMAPGEINYFDNDINYRKGHSWYLNQFPSKDYSKFWGEKTATYHFDEKVPQRIYQLNPAVKLIWIFRNPIERAYSNYWHRIKYGLEQDSFLDAIDRELKGTQNDKWGLYLKRSLYIDQIKLFDRFFSNDQMLFLVFEHFVSDVAQYLKEVLRFICSENNDPIIPPRKSKNLTYIPGSRRTLHLSRKLLGPGLAFKIIRKLLEKRTPGYPELDHYTRERLQSYFGDSIEELETYTHLNLSLWKD